MGKFEIGLASVMGVLVLGILVSISISPDSIPSGISLSMIEMTKNISCLFLCWMQPLPSLQVHLFQWRLRYLHVVGED